MKRPNFCIVASCVFGFHAALGPIEIFCMRPSGSTWPVRTQSFWNFRMSAGEFVKLVVIFVSSTSFFMHGTRARSLASRVYKTFHKSTPPAAYNSHGGIPDEVSGARIEAADETGDFAAASMVSCKILDCRATIA